MKRVLCGRTPWSTKKQQRSADSWIDGWISDHGYESGNDMYGYPMIWTRDKYDYVENAYSLSNYRGLLYEVQQALENSTSEKKFKDELDNLIDDHLGFVSDEQIDEMNEGVEDIEKGPQQGGNKDNNVLYLDDYSQEELEQINQDELYDNNIKVYYHHVLYEYSFKKYVTILDVDSENVVIDNPIVDDRTWLVSEGENKKHMKSLRFDLPTAIGEIRLERSDCEILDLSNVQCKRILLGMWYGGLKNTKFVKLPSSSNIEIKFGSGTFAEGKIQTIVNSEYISKIGTTCFDKCKNLKSLSLNPKCVIDSYAFEDSSLQFVDWKPDSLDLGTFAPIVRSYVHRPDLLPYQMALPFKDCPYQDYFIENYVEPYLDEMDN